MARTLTNREIRQMVLKILNDIMKEMGIKIAAQYLADFGKRNPTNKNYVRTGDLYRALLSPLGVFSKSGGENGGEIGEGNLLGWDLIDSSKIVPKTTEPWYKFNSHRNWNKEDEWNGLYVPDMVPIWLNSGFTIVNARGERFKFNGKKYIETALGLSSLQNDAISRYIEMEAAKRIHEKLIQMGVI